MGTRLPKKLHNFCGSLIQNDLHMEESSVFKESPAPSSDEKILAILAHVLTLIGWFIPPLIIYILKKDESSFVSQHAKESLNFQLTITLVCILLVISIIGALLLWAVGVIVLVFVILASIQANNGSPYRYPLNIRFIK